MTDPTAPDKGRALAVVGAGFGRTGTASLKLALEQLGFGPCYHMREVFENPSHAPVWERAARGEPVDWDALFSGYRSTVDWPGATFYDQLARRYPDAKVLLSVRDPERWYDSTYDTIYTISQNTSRGLGGLVLGGLPRFRRPSSMIRTLIWNGTFHGRFAEREYAVEVFNRHNSEVAQRIPADRLLVYDVKEGWRPLCAFLGVQEPGTEFPHANTTEEFRGFIRGVRGYTIGALLAIVAVGVTVAGRRRSRARRRAA